MRLPFPVQGFRLKVLQVAGGTAVAQGLLVLASPVLTRLYSPADFGVLVVYISLLAMLVILASLRYEYALPIPEDDGEATDLLAVCMLLVTATTTLSSLLLYVLRGRILGWLGVPGLGPFLWLVPVSIFGVGFYQVFNCWAIRKGGYRRIARTKVTQSVTQLALQVGVGAVVKGPFGLLLGHAVGRSNGTRTLAMLDWRNDWARLKQVRWAGMWRAMVRFRRFPVIASGTALMNAFNLRMPALLLAIYFGPAVAGWFALAQRVFALPSSVIGESVAQVYFGEVAATVNRDAGGLMVLFRGTIRRMFLLGLPLMLLAMAAGGFLFPLIFGRDWREAGIFVVAIGPMALAQFTAACADSTLVVLERQDLALYRELVRSGLLLSGILVAYLLKWPARPAIFLFGATGTLAYVIYGLITWYAIRQHRPARKAAP
ncbi:MAG: oligosaccharide flippase family protein [Holophaga sp.]|nr:oligosaccharide flippase family protein [Holophaga sp.]